MSTLKSSRRGSPKAARYSAAKRSQLREVEAGGKLGMFTASGSALRSATPIGATHATAHIGLGLREGIRCEHSPRFRLRERPLRAEICALTFKFVENA